MFCLGRPEVGKGPPGRDDISELSLERTRKADVPYRLEREKYTEAEKQHE